MTVCDREAVKDCQVMLYGPRIPKNEKIGNFEQFYNLH